MKFKGVKEIHFPWQNKNVMSKPQEARFQDIRVRKILITFYKMFFARST